MNMTAKEFQDDIDPSVDRSEIQVCYGRHIIQMPYSRLSHSFSISYGVHFCLASVIQQTNIKPFKYTEMI